MECARWSGKCIQGLLEPLFFKDAKVQSEGRCFCVELQFLWTLFFFFFTMLKQYLLEYVTKRPLSCHWSVVMSLWTIYEHFISRSGFVDIFFGNGLDVVFQLFAFTDSDIQKWYLWTVPKGRASHISAHHFFLLQYTYKWMFCFSWKLDLYSTLLLWTGPLSPQCSGPSEPRVEVTWALQSESIHLNETGNEKTERTVYVSGRSLIAPSPEWQKTPWWSTA